ncbi:MAG TPA: helix-turn-helix transcriptional regulator [Gammaproteobacteria bacterium]|jgi:DNA-binding PadR family transcriptional regulator
MARRRNISPQTKVLIAALLEAPVAWRHGYELSKLTGLKSGTLYPVLMRLGDQGLLESKWEPSPQAGRPPRHVYRLTLRGVALAQEQAASQALERGPIASPA